MDYIEIIIKDGNRTVNWIFPVISTITDVLNKWEKNYYPCNRKRVIIENKRLLEDYLDCRLSSFKSFGEKIVIRLETVFPKKEEGGEENG